MQGGRGQVPFTALVHSSGQGLLSLKLARNFPRSTVAMFHLLPCSFASFVRLCLVFLGCPLWMRQTALSFMALKLGRLSERLAGAKPPPLPHHPAAGSDE
jgi:hypothetical protein